ncbi:MAG: hypothetical protein LBG57_10175, partial [Treponema sp.]|nr:hypothetical protein [Treponema sp.]
GNTGILINTSDPSATIQGGGVYVDGTFTMTGGTIRDNTARHNGGGVYIAGGSFTKTGGTIYGDTNTTHTAGADENTSLTGNGHAVYIGAGPKKRNADAGSSVNLDSATADNWE